MNNDTALRGSDSIGWILDGLLTRTPGSRHATVLSSDGLPLARSQSLSREDAEHLAAMASALHSLARGVGSRFNTGQFHQTVIEMSDGYLVLTEAGFGACLALLAGPAADLGVMAYEMNVITGQVRDHLSAAPRTSTMRTPLRP